MDKMVNEEFKKLTRWSKPLIVVFPLILILFAMGQSTQAVPNGGYAHPEILIQPEELKVLIEKKDPIIRIIDIREKLQYLSGHLPGAVQTWRPDIEDKNHPIPGMMAPQPQIEELLENLGISEKNTLIIYSDLYDHARLWWILAYYGFPLKQMKLLDGGIDAWKAKGYPLEIIPTQVEKTRFKLRGETKGRKPLLCNLAEVKSALRKSDKVVLDVRTKNEYAGEEIKKGATRGGRIPGVVWIEWKETIVEEGPYKGYWKSAEEIKKTFSAKEVTPEKDVYLY
jgi:thiosulfate/3-mercaptopyruvate sulfurtransferase